MKYINFSLPSPAENLAADEVLLDLCEADGEGEILRFWEPDRLFVVLGYANRAAVEANLPACEEHQIGVYRRCSGGGTVLQGPGCLNYSLFLRIPESGPLQNITGANQFILQRQQAALEPLLRASVKIQGHTDLTVRNLKFSGNAQRRRRNFLIFHGTFLLDFDITQAEKFLRMPSQQPGYRQDRSHAEFLTNLNLPPEQVKAALQKAWNATEVLNELPLEKITHLSRTKYSTAEWNFKL